MKKEVLVQWHVALLASKAVPPPGQRDRGNIKFHKLINLRGKINMEARSAKALFHKFIDHSNNQCPEFITC